MTSSEDTLGLPEELLAALPNAARVQTEPLVAQAKEKGFGWLEVHFASLPRRVGRTRIEGGIIDFGGTTGRVDLGGLRVPEIAAVAVLSARELDDAELRRLYDQGDQEERRMILRALPHLPDRPVRARLLEEAHRSNDVLLFEAAFCDRDLPARILDDHAYGNAVLKAAFIDLALERFFGWETRGSEELSSKLLDFMDERLAAGRPVWGPTMEVCALAPKPEVARRLPTELEAPVARRRLAAARAIAVLAEPELAAAARDRLGAESDPIVREALEEAAGSAR